MQPCPERVWGVIPWTQNTTGLTKGFVSLKDLLLRLNDGPNWCAGNVEIYYFGAWEKVCGYLWDMQDATVVCRQLGCGFPLAAMYPFPPSNLYPYMITEVNCTGNENYVWQCPYTYKYSPCYHGAASVICSDSGITVTPATAPAVSRFMPTRLRTTTGMSRGAVWLH
ncbi:deleted in malignant brain tumors 1 protein-like [Anomalospiza imberbis]|uniref:deleted in malignant brain tumors 1 protein-like n=1 Tax=Anomalospiza imberbis TaxID=187417 RepID=UPI00358F3AD8